MNCTRRLGGALTLGGGEMVDRGAVSCDFSFMMLARAVAGLGRGGLSGVGGWESSKESVVAGMGGRLGSVGDATAGAAPAPPLMSSM